MANERVSVAATDAAAGSLLVLGEQLVRQSHHLSIVAIAHLSNFGDIRVVGLVRTRHAPMPSALSLTVKMVPLSHVRARMRTCTCAYML